MAATGMPALSSPHGFRDSVRWRVTPKGVEVDGKIERTKGDPITVTSVWERFHEAINGAAARYQIPVQLIIATICTESGGRADAIRFEPRFVSDEATPHQVSPGLMQTLISTARSAMGNPSINRSWLLEPASSIMAGTAYIRAQANVTKLDPPLVACAYNAGGVYYDTDTHNRWRMRQYPIGTSVHCDRFVKWFNDACAMLATHPIRAAVGLEAIIGETPRRRDAAPKAVAASKIGAAKTIPASFVGTAAAAKARIAVAFGRDAKRDAITPYSKRVLDDVLRKAGITAATISSTQRTPQEQARVMFENLERVGVQAQKHLYGPFGDMIIDVYVRGKAAKKNAAQIQKEMAARIVAVGPTNVSHHAANPKVLNVLDIAPMSIPRAKWDALEKAVRTDQRVKLFFRPPADTSFHLEIPQPPSFRGR